MKIEIFDVEHGGCALVTTDTGLCLLADCGQNSTTGWRPSVALPRMGITNVTELFITNYDEDHVSDLPNLREVVSIDVLTRNPTVSGYELLKLKSEVGAGTGITELALMTKDYTAPISSYPSLGQLSYELFWNSYPTDFDDENNLSLVVFFDYPGLNIVFAGDLETAGWKKLLENERFRRALSRVNVFVASHHGRLSGYCEDVFIYCHPMIVIFSDEGVQYETQKTADLYKKHAVGMTYNGKPRWVFTTRNDGPITLTADGTGSCYINTGR